MERARPATAYDAVATRLIRRRLMLLAASTILSGAYAASWSMERPSPWIALASGAQANNVAMLFAFMPWIIFLAAVLPEDLDSSEARRSIGPLLAVSDISGVYVFVCTIQAYRADRAEAARIDYNERMCLYILHGVCVFFAYWSVVHPTACFFRLSRLRMSWKMLRRGLVVDASAFCLFYGLLWCFGETRYPPGDVPLSVAIFGRPTIALLTSALLTPRNRQRIKEWGLAAGLLHVRLDLHHLTQNATRELISMSGYDTPSSDGNHGQPSSISSTEESSSEYINPGAPQSHHTFKLD